ncbi:FRG domain-containing protein [Variovorax sp. J22P240]|uniref:FRG domain-containing protein n=1 Tax=Variovorax sp. J22P240 TaxID=3053514 RepID=UPI002578B2E8|nr:FRG domain-containing protein [Variovorax sp. J22P240]MDM0002809.1 FRG domain-containing protein [Variovorax sp. J22P240]
MRYAASSLEEALLQAEQMRAAGATWFRGQTRNWPISSSLFRRATSDQSAAIERFERFWNWLHSVPALSAIAANEDAALAVAQHYGLATNLIDFSTEPKVAAFFAAHNPPPQSEAEDFSCIICLNYGELEEICNLMRLVRPEMPVLRAIKVNIPELWRIQAQRGVFLDYPFDVSFEKRTFDFDRIVFPTPRDRATLERLDPEADIYPTQKSDLEMLLDQYFMLETIEKGSRRIRELDFFTPIHVQGLANGIEGECFGPGGLPIHESWEPDRLAEWLTLGGENWRPQSTAPGVMIHYPAGDDSHAKIATMKDQCSAILSKNPSLRTGPVHWSLLGIPPEARLTRGTDLVWDGLRRWPYSDSDVAQALATAIEFGMLVNEQPTARHDVELARQLAEQCFGCAVEIEIEIEDGSYSRGFFNESQLSQLVRQDFAGFLTNDWRPRIRGIRAVLQVASDPKRVLVFHRLNSLFCTQFVPTQVVLRDELSGKARLYNLARTARIGLA